MRKLKSILSLKRVKFIVLSVLALLAVHGDIKEQFLRQYVGRNTYKVLSGGGSGSGFVIRYGGKSVVITNAHVCGDQRTVGLEDKNHVAVGVAKVLATNEELDLCAVENIERKFGLYVQNHDSYIGQTLNIVGHPSGRKLTIHSGAYIGTVEIELAKAKFKTCRGRIVELDPITQILTGLSKICVEKYPSMGVAAIAFPGNSGSAVVSNFGTVVGVLFAGSNELTDSFVIPRERLIEFLESL